MAFMAKARAERHYNAGTHILVVLQGKTLSPSLLEPHDVVRHIGDSLGKASGSTPKDLEKAVKHLQKAVKLKPDFASAFHKLAHAWYNIAEYNTAIGDFREYVMKDINEVKETSARNATADDLIKRIRDQTQDARGAVVVALEFALEAVDRSLSIRHNFSQAYITRAMILEKMGRFEEAIKAIENARLHDMH